MIHPHPNLKMVFRSCVAVDVTVSAGAAAWVDTDLSAICGTSTNRIWMFQMLTGPAGAFVGVRPHGDAATPQAPASTTILMLSRVDGSGHVDFLRDAAQDCSIRIPGYLELN